jgi:hypothetical protein
MALMKCFKLLTGCLVLFIIWVSCANHVIVHDTNLTISLRWVKSYPGESKDEVVTGLAWNLSFLGAELPTGSLNQAIQWEDSHFTLDLSQVGFRTSAQESFIELINFLKSSDEYRARGGIDLGRFIMLTLNSTNHYYAITGAPRTYSAFRAQYIFDEKKAGISPSTIAFGDRLIELSTGSRLDKIAFVATEGEGSIKDGTFVAREFETLDFMKNGQLRFALYDMNGNLKLAASKSLTAAGKPSKCLWCHELGLQKPFNDAPQLSGYYTTEEFKGKLDERTNLIHAYRNTLSSEINFSKTQDHTKGELLYLAFMEPSAERLAEEWSISVEEVKQALIHISTHEHDEFSFLGDKLYHRKDIDHLAPYETVQVPEDPRNLSQYEPDFIH